jgi:nucleoside-diphosphate-sugar epimerase
LSTRSQTKAEQLVSERITPHLVDIEQIDPSIVDFLDTECLIINITSKNTAAFNHLIDYIKASPVKHVLFVSSSSVYRSTNTLVSESSNDEDETSVLLQIEQLFRNSAGFQTTILRLSGLIGYERHPGRFFRNGKVVQQPDAPVNLIHQDDCVGLIECILTQQQWGTVFNGCADTHPSKRDYYTYTRQLLNLGAPDFADNQPNNFKIVSNQKVKDTLGYEFKYPDIMTIPFGDGA